MFIKNKRSGFTLVEIMIVVAIIALLAAIGIPSLLNARKAANESTANADVKTICTELETYAAQNNGAYPADTATLASNTATRDCGATVGGYAYTCTLAVDDYTIVAAPSSTTAGTKTYTGTVGGQVVIS